MSKFDQIYRRLLLTKFFVHGWGKPENLKRLFDFRKILSKRDTCQHLVAKDYPISIDKNVVQGDVRIVEGHFLSPFTQHLPGIMPKEVETAKFQMILPKKWKTKLKPVCLQLAGTGDHFFWRRRSLVALPLLKEAGIASILLENPYYGVRKPKEQLRSSLLNVSDLFVMGGALVLESLALLYWCERQGYGPLGLTGISMGGHMASAAACSWPRPISLVPGLSWTTASSVFTQMASLAASNWPKPLTLVPCLSWSTASIVFTQGVLSGAIPWKTLQNQYSQDSVYETEITKMVESPEVLRETDAFKLGQTFAKNYPESLDHLKKLRTQYYKGVSVNGSSNDCEFKSETSVNDSSNDREFNSDKNSPQQSCKVNSAAGASHESSTPTFQDGKDFTFAVPEDTLPAEQEGRDVFPQSVKDKPNVVSSTTQMHTSARHFSDQSSKKKKNNSIYDSITKELNKRIVESLTWKRKPSSKNTLQDECTDFMRGIMDDCTHLGNFDVPVDPELVIIVAAKQDAYVPRDSVLSLQELWPGSELRYIDSGHIAAFLLHQSVFRKAIIDSFERQINKYYSESQ